MGPMQVVQPRAKVAPSRVEPGDGGGGTVLNLHPGKALAEHAHHAEHDNDHAADQRHLIQVLE